MRQTVYLQVAAAEAWNALASAAWGADEDGAPDIPFVVSVDGPFRTEISAAEFDDDGVLATPAVFHDHLAVNLIAPPGYIWPDEITDVQRPAPGNPRRRFP